jgi:hypothetical protein
MRTSGGCRSPRAPNLRFLTRACWRITDLCTYLSGSYTPPRWGRRGIVNFRIDEVRQPFAIRLQERAASERPFPPETEACRPTVVARSLNPHLPAAMRPAPFPETKRPNHRTARTAGAEGDAGNPTPNPFPSGKGNRKRAV